MPVHILNLSDCDKIPDVSALINLHILNLTRCNITDLSTLRNIHTLNLSECDITAIIITGMIR